MTVPLPDRNAEPREPDASREMMRSFRQHPTTAASPGLEPGPKARSAGEPAEANVSSDQRVGSP
jgi:hypothetical protein